MMPKFKPLLKSTSLLESKLSKFSLYYQVHKMSFKSRMLKIPKCEFQYHIFLFTVFFICRVSEVKTVPAPSFQSGTVKRPPPLRSGGLSGLASQLGSGKKPKLSTLEKSKLDWDRFKNDEGIAEDLKTFNQGKQGFLERQAFLERADVKQFEIERSLRAGRKTK